MDVEVKVTESERDVTLSELTHRRSQTLQVEDVVVARQPLRVEGRTHAPRTLGPRTAVDRLVGQPEPPSGRHGPHLVVQEPHRDVPVTMQDREATEPPVPVLVAPLTTSTPLSLARPSQTRRRPYHRGRVGNDRRGVDRP